MCADRRAKLADVVVDRQNSTLEDEQPPALLEWAKANRQKEGGLVSVAPGLFLGNKTAAADANLLHRKGVVGVCAVGARQVFAGAGHHISIEDDGSTSMLPYFEAACSFIHQHRQQGAVLVHCKGGISRSPTMVIAYLMRHEHLSLTDAIEVCSCARPAARPREVFLQDLARWQEHLREERQPADEVSEERWRGAVELATEETVAAIGPQTPGPSKEAVRAECSRLLDALQAHCIREVFGEVLEPTWQLREAARAAVTSYAGSQGWRRAVRKEASSGTG